MSFAKLRNSIIAARNERQDILQQYLAKGCPATVFFSLNIPGGNKNRPGTSGLFGWAQKELQVTFPSLRVLCVHKDALGPYSIIHINLNADEAKQLCIGIETAQPSARLIDLDVYDHNGKQIDRVSRGLPLRQCLACERPAVECMRLNRHTPDEITGITDGLLASFRD